MLVGQIVLLALKLSVLFSVFTQILLLSSDLCSLSGKAIWQTNHDRKRPRTTDKLLITTDKLIHHVHY
mgnify:CR=1 FL=1